MQAIFRASRHLDKTFRIRAPQIRIAKPKGEAIGPPGFFLVIQSHRRCAASGRPANGGLGQTQGRIEEEQVLKTRFNCVDSAVPLVSQAVPN